MAEGLVHVPQFSVLLPTHNRADVLPFAIRSVLGQTVQDFEFLIVGDGCTDHTAEVVASFADPRIHWFDLPKAPHFGYANRNIALRQARGVYVAFMAHDDLWLLDHLELLSSSLERPGVDLAYSRPLWVAPDGTITPGIFNLHDARTLETFLARRLNGIPAGCVIHRRECFAKYGYWNETLPQIGDLDMWARIIEGGGRKNFEYVAEPTCLHFRANWRTEANTGPAELRVWRVLHTIDGALPSALRVAVAEGMTEQEAVWRLMSAKPREWSSEVRTAVHQALDFRVSQNDEMILELAGPVGESSRSRLVRRVVGIRYRTARTLRERIRVRLFRLVLRVLARI